MKFPQWHNTELEVVLQNRLRDWVILMVINAVCSAPLDDQRIYFPGENPNEELETRSYLQPQQVQPIHRNVGNVPAAEFLSHQHVQQIPDLQVEGAIPQKVAYASHLIPNLQPQQLPPGYVYGQIPSTAGASNAEIGNYNLLEHPHQPTYGEQSAQVSGYGGQLQGAMRHHSTHWESTNTDGSNFHSPLSHGSSAGSINQHSSQSEGAQTFIQNNQLNPETHLGLAKNGKANGRHTISEQKWTHFSTTGTGQSPHDQKQLFQQQETEHQGYLGQNHRQDQTRYSHGSNVVGELSASHASDLSTILDEPSMQQGHDLHPSIKHALDNVARDLDDTSLRPSKQPTHHTIHKISHIKKTTVQNIGREPSHIQSTSTNDDINLSDLIKQLQLLEESPRHTNITWCEEKIKEFLRALRRKQDSGIFVNQEVQEQTLHQILTQEAVQNTGSYDGVNEPPMTKVTIKPLGGEHLTNSEVTSNFVIHEQQNHSGVKDIKNERQEEQLNNLQEEVLPQQEEIITVIPDQGLVKPPEIMAHQNESPREPPPFTSDNASNLGELELELPEYPKDTIQNTPIKQTHAEEVEAFENNIQRVTRPLNPPLQTEEAASGQQKETSLEEALQQEGEPTHTDTSKYQTEHGTIYQESLTNIQGGNQIHHNHESVPPNSGSAETMETQQTTIETSSQNQKENSFPHHLNTPEKTEHEISDELDLQLPEYHPILEESHHNNIPERTEHEISDDLDLQMPEYHPISEDSNTINGLESHSSEQLQHSNHKYNTVIPSMDNGYKQSSSREEEMHEEVKVPSGYDLHHSGNDVNHVYVGSAEVAHHHVVHGRPNAPLQGANGTNEQKEQIHEENTEHLPNPQENSPEIKVVEDHKIAMNKSQQTMHGAEDHKQAQEIVTGSLPNLQQQQLNYDTLIEELIQLESLPGHQAIDKCEEKIQEFLEILKYQQEQGFGRNQLELQRLHQTLIEQAERRNKELSSPQEGLGGSTLPPTSFWRKVQKKIKKTYENAKDRAKEVIG